jgi:rhamnosyltransferase
MSKKIVVMLATYNGEKFLREQLDSICCQTFSKDILLYIGDDGSSDSTLSIIEEYKNKIDILERVDKNHLGAALNFWNLLLTAPEAEFYAFCDQDDIWDKNKLEIAIKKINDINKPVLYYSNMRIIDKNSKIIKEKSVEKEPILTIPSQIVCGQVAGCTILFNQLAMQIFRKNKISNISMHDTVTTLSMLAIGEIIYDSEPRISYRHHENNVIAKSKKNFFKKISSTYKLWIKNKNINSILAKDLLNNYESMLDADVKKWLFYLSNYKKQYAYKFKLLADKQTVSNNTRALRSFKIRLLLGLI